MIFTELKIILFDGPLNILLVCIPAAMAAYYANAPESLTFIAALLALAPLAERLGFVTEQLSLHTNETIGGLLNATFGNATELIVAIIALYKKLYRLVQLSLLGSILSNMLLVLGTAFLCGGLKRPTQRFNKITTQVNSVLLMISTMSILFPAALMLTQKQSFLSVLEVSRGSSVLAFFLYAALIFFQLKTHKNLFEDAPLRDPPTASSILTFNTKSATTGVKYSALSQLNELDETLHDNKSRQEEEITSRDKVHLAVLSRNSFSLIADDEDGGSHGDEDEESLFGMKEGDEKKRDILPLSMTADETRELSITSAESLSPLEEAEDKRDQSTEKVKEGAEEGEREEKPEEDGEDGEEEEEVVLSYRSSMIYLGVITVFIAILSEIISSTIETAASSLHLSGIFIATIVLPIVGNAAEHTSAIVFAMKNKLNLTLGIAIGSSTQIALCVLPLVVILGWMSDLDMSLEFGYYESVCLFVSVFCLTIALKDGESNWFVGLTMIVAYVIIAMGFFVHKNSSLSADEGR